MWRLNNMWLNNQWVQEEIKREMKVYLETNENGTSCQNMELSKCSKREVHSDKCLPQETRKISNKQHNFTPQETRKRCRCMNTLNVHLYLEQFLLRDNWGATEELLHNKEDREKPCREDMGNVWASQNLKETISNEGGSEDHCLHSPCTWIVRAKVLPKLCVNYTPIYKNEK